MTKNQLGKLNCAISKFKTLYRSPTLLAFLTGWLKHTSLGLVHFLLAAFLGRYPRALVSLTSWCLQGISALNITASYNVLSTKHWFGDILDTCMASAPFFRHGGKFCKLLLLSLPLKPEPHGWNCQVMLATGAVTWSPHSITYLQDFYSSLPNLGCPEIRSLHQMVLKLRGLPSSALPACVTTNSYKLFFNSFLLVGNVAVCPTCPVSLAPK